MYLHWRETRLPDTYDVAIVENKREPGKGPRRRTVVYLGRVVERYDHPKFAAWWQGVESKLSAAVAAGRLTQEQAEGMASELLAVIPKPVIGKRGYVSYKPVFLPPILRRMRS